MSKLLHFIEELILPLIALISTIVSVGDLFNLFHLVPPGNIPMLILLIVSMALGSLCFIQNKCNEIHHDLQRLLSRPELDHMKETIAQINPDLRRVLHDDYFLNIVDFFHTVVNEGKVQVNDFSRFRLYLKHTLQAFSKATFLLTSSLTTPYLWKKRDIEDALKDFICTGGRIKQIFFVKSPAELASQEIQAMLAHQQNIGIEVHIVDSTSIPDNLKQYFFVESRKKFAWEIPIDHEGHVGSSVITANKQVTGNYCTIFEKLWNNVPDLSKDA
jgi:hypothetical protein